jgi:hypothetical protein
VKFEELPWISDKKMTHQIPETPNCTMLGLLLQITYDREGISVTNLHGRPSDKA